MLPEVIGQLNRDGSAAGSLLEYRSPGQDFVLLLDRHWQVLQEQPQLTVLRWVEDGQFVAQCTLKPLPALGGNKPPALAVFSAKSSAASGSRPNRWSTHGESELVAGLRALKVIVRRTRG